MQHMVTSLSTSGRGGRSIHRLSEKTLSYAIQNKQNMYITTRTPN